MIFVKFSYEKSNHYLAPVLILEKYYSAIEDRFYVKVNVEGYIVHHPVDITAFSNLAVGKTYPSTVMMETESVMIIKINYEGIKRHF